ncbi:MAG TPA: carboxypeptidase-like regulatory domain-containing protein [Candidatus Sulfotelmatobacter sp.]|nr:carboxypeptidase-like regulatory domain-containing protein [Candidatus Sulfotelmatobacter sp.]
MKNISKNIFIALLLCCVCAAEEKSALPLPDPGNVTLTLDEYNKLVELAAKPPKHADIAPLPYSLKHADLSLHVDNDAVRGKVELEGEVFRKGVSKVPLATGMTVLDAHQNGKSLPLLQENGTHMALLSGPAEFSIALDTGLPLRIEAGRASFSLPVPAAGSVQLALLIPGDHTSANISPGLITSRKSQDGHTAIEATLVPGQPATIWWTTRETVVPTVPREVRFLSDAKTLVSVSEAEMRVTVLADISVVQGEPSQFQLELPAGYEVTGATGATLDSTEIQSGVLTLKVNAPAQRSQQFLISMERSIATANADVPLITFKGAQRETGEVLIEGAGAMELTATEGGGLKRMDLKEANPYLRSLAHFPPQAAFRYHKQPGESPTLALQWVRFPDGSVLAAEAESAVVTTLVTSEGKSLTEVKLIVKNQAQPFLKVSLPAGATILSADVGGEPVKPVQGPDGNRVPLLRPGFHPTDSYVVSFVFMHSGAPFAKKGGADLSLPSMDIPISLLNWEVFLPEQYKVKDFGGDVIAANRVPPAFRADSVSYQYEENREALAASNVTLGVLLPGQLGGVLADPSGAVLPNARITVTQPDSGFSMSTITDQSGRWIVSNLRTGRVRITASAPGFQTAVRDAVYDASRGSAYSFALGLPSATETVEVTAAAPALNGRDYSELKQLGKNEPQQNASANVLNLQRRVAGVLPVAIEVPRTGTSFSFVRPLVLDEETKVTFSYNSR